MATMFVKWSLGLIWLYLLARGAYILYRSLYVKRLGVIKFYDSAGHWLGREYLTPEPSSLAVIVGVKVADRHQSLS